MPSVVLYIKLPCDPLDRLWSSRALGFELFTDPRKALGIFLVLLPSSCKEGSLKLLGWPCGVTIPEWVVVTPAFESKDWLSLVKLRLPFGIKTDPYCFMLP